jgi:hypothetical protein
VLGVAGSIQEMAFEIKIMPGLSEVNLKDSKMWIENCQCDTDRAARRLDHAVEGYVSIAKKKGERWREKKKSAYLDSGVLGFSFLI